MFGSSRKKDTRKSVNDVTINCPFFISLSDIIHANSESHVKCIWEEDSSGSLLRRFDPDGPPSNRLYRQTNFYNAKKCIPDLYSVQVDSFSNGSIESVKRVRLVNADCLRTDFTITPHLESVEPAVQQPIDSAQRASIAAPLVSAHHTLQRLHPPLNPTPPINSEFLSQLLPELSAGHLRPSSLLLKSQSPSVLQNPEPVTETSFSSLQPASLSPTQDSNLQPPLSHSSSPSASEPIFAQATAFIPLPAAEASIDPAVFSLEDYTGYQLAYVHVEDVNVLGAPAFDAGATEPLASKTSDAEVQTDRFLLDALLRELVAQSAPAPASSPRDSAVQTDAVLPVAVAATVALTSASTSTSSSTTTSFSTSSSRVTLSTSQPSAFQLLNPASTSKFSDRENLTALPREAASSPVFDVPPVGAPRAPVALARRSRGRPRGGGRGGRRGRPPRAQPIRAAPESPLGEEEEDTGDFTFVPSRPRVKPAPDSSRTRAPLPTEPHELSAAADDDSFDASAPEVALESAAATATATGAEADEAEVEALPEPEPEPEPEPIEQLNTSELAEVPRAAAAAARPVKLIRPARKRPAAAAAPTPPQRQLLTRPASSILSRMFLAARAGPPATQSHTFSGAESPANPPADASTSNT